MLFDVTMSIVNRFPSVNPFDVRKESFYEIMKLISHITAVPKNVIVTDEKIIIRREAGDDFY